MSIEPLSPMNMPGGVEVVETKPAQAPASAAQSSAAVIASDSPLTAASR